MSVENIVEQYLNEGFTEEYKVLMNVLMDKLELGEITEATVVWPRVSNKAKHLVREHFGDYIS